MAPAAAVPHGPEGPQQGDAEHIAADPEAKAFMDDWATPESISR